MPNREEMEELAREACEKQWDALDSDAILDLLTYTSNGRQALDYVHEMYVDGLMERELAKLHHPARPGHRP